jgi:peptidase E
MKLVLASQGFTTKEIAEATANLAGKPLKSLSVAVINEAYVPIQAGRDQTWLIDELSLISKYVKGSIFFVNIRAYTTDEILKRLEPADVVYIVGGSQLALPKLFRDTGFDSVLNKIVSSKVVVGTSAGACVLGRRIEDTLYWQDQYGSVDEYLAEPLLELVDFNILPHFAREDHPRRVTSIIEPLLKNCPFLLYGVTDTQAVIQNGTNTSFIGGDPVTFGLSNK